MKRHGIIVKPTGNLGATFNPAAIKIGDDKYILLVRSVPKGYVKTGPVNQFDDNYTSQLSLWEGKTPDQFKLINEDALMPTKNSFDQFGAEDPRITKIKDTYYICYTSIAIGLGQPNAGDGIRIAMASTKDFKTYKKHGVIGPDQRTKAGILFQSGNNIYLIWKDETNDIERTMISAAPADFENADAWKTMWNDPAVSHHELLGPQNNNYEDYGVEPGAQPIEVDEGLLLVYSSISKDMKWTISAMMLDKNDPKKILSKTHAPILIPQESYELSGDVNNVVFPCGAIIDQNRLYVYYGAADTICAVASESMDVIREKLLPYVPQKTPPLKP